MSVLEKRTRTAEVAMEPKRRRMGKLRNVHAGRPLKLHQQLIWKLERSMLNGGNWNSSPKLKHIDLRSLKVWMTQCQHGLQNDATEI